MALKILAAEFLRDPSFASRFECEAKIIARLEHPNIVPSNNALQLTSGGCVLGCARVVRLERARDHQFTARS